MGVVIKQCSCKSAFQDKTYGSGNRVHNQGKKVAICTVCGTPK